MGGLKRIIGKIFENNYENRIIGRKKGIIYQGLSTMLLLGMVTPNSHQCNCLDLHVY